MLPELLSRQTELPVVEISDRIQVEKNHVYVAPPGGVLDILNGVVFRVDADIPQSPRLPIDHFFRSLAEDQKEHAVGIILSGTGSDGTLGLQAIKGESGMTMVQNLESAKYAGMPGSAISSGIADFVLSPPEMPDQLVRYMRSPYAKEVADEQKNERLSASMRKIFVLIRSRTGHDFSAYKMSTVTRRIERRLNIHAITDPDHYVQYLQENPHEIDILFKELLISVTKFFRDPESFEVLRKKILPNQLRKHPENTNLRAWVPGCATGEEAYSLAILLRECLADIPSSADVQIFGTDLDSAAIETARAGRYPEGIAVDVEPDRLKRFFALKDNAFHIQKNIREMVVFAVQNVIKDPPFTKLDFISCRNLLIYLNSDLQKKLFPIFHYALKPGGLLFIGPSETIGSFSDLFEVVDRKWKIYRRKEAPSKIHSLVDFPSVAVGARQELQVQVDRAADKARPMGITSLIDKLLLKQFAPASVVVNDRGEIVFIYGRTGAYLEPAAGQARLNIYDMAREGLKLELASALRNASGKSGMTKRESVRIESNGESIYIDLTVQRILEPESLRGLFLVAFQPCSPAVIATKVGEAGDSDPHQDKTLELEQELLHTKEYLRTTIEELETSNEELKSTNEELQSTNEELQSSNEELETSKEEMQSLNEELTTVNTELTSKIEDLTRVNSDMQNLLNNTEIATIFLDNDLKVKRFTEGAKDLVKLIQSDIGRPLDDLASNMDYSELAADGRDVLRTLNYKTAEIRRKDGRWYLMRMMPYRTAENSIDGLVITFVDIHRVKTAEWKLSQAKEHLAADLKAMRQLHKIGTLFLLEGVTEAIFEEVLDAAISISQADMGYLQRVDITTGKLKVLEQRGFKQSWLRKCDQVELDQSSFWMALKRGERVIVDSVEKCKYFADTSLVDDLMDVGVQVVESTPLISHTGKLFGVISTCHKMPHESTDRAVHLMDLLAQQAAEIFESAEHQTKQSIDKS